MVNMTKNFEDKFYKVNPALMPFHTLPVRINRYFTDVNGTLVNKMLVPASLQTEYPVYMFGEFDRQGGYKQSHTAIPPRNEIKFVGTFTYGIGMPFLAFTGLNTIKGVLSIGDVCNIFTDNIENPNYFIWIVLSANPVSLASVSSNTESTQRDNRIGRLYIEEFNMSAPVTLQYYNPFFFTRLDNIGNIRYDTYIPAIDRTPYNDQNIVTVKTEFKLDQYIGINFYMLFDADELSLNFKVSPI